MTQYNSRRCAQTALLGGHMGGGGLLSRPPTGQHRIATLLKLGSHRVIPITPTATKISG